MVNEIELKPCPFCGGPARFNDRGISITAGCNNDGCGVWPYTKEYYDDDNTAAYIAAAESWNRRA